MPDAGESRCRHPSTIPENRGTLGATDVDFYISYVSAARTWAEWIGWELDDAGYRTALDARDLRSGYTVPPAAVGGTSVLIAVISEGYVRSGFSYGEWTTALAEGKVLPIWVDESQAGGAVRSGFDVVLADLDEDEARTRLLAAAADALARYRGRPAGAPAFPRAVEERAVQEPAAFPASLPPFAAVGLEVRVGDVLTAPADVVAFKHASGFHGADAKAAERLRSVGYSNRDLAALPGDHKLVEARGALAARAALFVGVGQLLDLGYEEIRSFGRRTVEIAAGLPRVRHLAVTAHGQGIGLDVREAFLSQVAGFLEALQRQPPAAELAFISVVESNPELADVLGAALEEHLPDIPHAWIQGRADGVWRFGMGATARGVRSRSRADRPPDRPIRLLERTPDARPHLFIAYPFELEDHARFGIERPAHEAGFLARLIGDQVYTGEILARIKEQIESAALVVAVLTKANPNVYLEIGYAWGRDKPTLLVAAEGEELGFDVAGHRAISYANISDLEKKFKAQLAELAPPEAP